MNEVTNTFNNIYAGLNNFEQGTDRFFDFLDEKVNFLKEKRVDIKKVYSGVRRDVEEACQTVDTVCKKLDEVYKNTMSTFMHGIGVVDSAVKKVKGIVFPGKKTAKTSSGTKDYEQTTKSPSVEQSEKQPLVSSVPKVDKKQEEHTALDDLVKGFSDNVKQINNDFDVKIDVYDKGLVIKSYALDSNVEEEDKEQVVTERTIHNKNKTYLDSLLEQTDKKYIDDSLKITKLYNHGYNTYKIVREANRRGYAGINNYNDITDRVAVGLNSGLEYTKEKYNNAIATKLGAGEQIINNYLSGKSYKEIKENLKKNTNGMNISDSSILRIMHNYENNTGKKVVGKRNGNGKGNNKSNNNKSKKKGSSKSSNKRK